MKQILEVGDRVKLMEGEFVGQFIGVTGVVNWVADEPNDDGSRSVVFVLSEEDRVRMQRVPGFTISTVDAKLKYLKPKKEKKKAAKLDAKFAKTLDGLGSLLPIAATPVELRMVCVISCLLSALDVIADTDSAGRNPSLKEIKEAMLEELR